MSEASESLVTFDLFCYKHFGSHTYGDIKVFERKLESTYGFLLVINLQEAGSFTCLLSVNQRSSCECNHAILQERRIILDFKGP